MATYPIKMLKDENNSPFVPLVGANAIIYNDTETLEEKLDKKLEKTNIIAGDNITLSIDGNNITINGGAGSSISLINNLTTSTAGQGALDAYQGKVLKGMIDALPSVIDDITSTSQTNALSANQGRILNNKFNDYALTSTLNNYLLLSGGTLTGQVKSTKQSEEAILISHGGYGIGAGIKCIREDTGTTVSLQVGSGGINHGIYSHTLNKWMVYGDASNIYLNGNAATATKATQDGSGNIITSTYLKLDNINRTYSTSQTQPYACSYINTLHHIQNYTSSITSIKSGVALHSGNSSQLVLNGDGLVTVNLSFNTSASVDLSNNTVLCIIPAALRPKGNVIFNVFSPTDVVNNTRNVSFGYLRSASGEVMVNFKKTLPAGYEIIVLGSYYINY